MTHDNGAYVKGFCPRGCGETLFLGDGGYVTCSWIECPEPDAAHRLLTEKLSIDGVIEYCDRRIGEIDNREIGAEDYSYWRGMRTGIVQCRSAAIREKEVRERFNA